MNPIPVVRSSALRPIAMQLGALGLIAEDWLEKAGVPDEALRSPDFMIPERPIWALFDLLRHRAAIEDIGFQLASGHRVTDVETVAPLVSGHPTLHRTLQAFCGELRAHASAWDYWVEATPHRVRLCRRPTPVGVDPWPIEQYMLLLMIDVVRMAAPATWWPNEIWLQVGDDLTENERDWLREARIHFGSPITAISIPAWLLPRQPRAAAVPACQAPIETLPTDYLEAFHGVLRTYLPEGWARLERVASALGLHPRSLQRQLAQRGTSFQRVLDQVRLEVARERLMENAVPLSEIGLELGYESQSAFTRSFRRWTGFAPSRYREANRPRAS